MLKMMVNTGKKKSKAAYKKFLLRVGLVSLILGPAFLILGLILKEDSFTKGLFAGMGGGCLINAFVYLSKVTNDRVLNQAYIEAYDERNQYLTQRTTLYVLGLVLLEVIVLIFLKAVWSISFSYLILPVTLLYSILLGWVIIRSVLNQLL